MKIIRSTTSPFLLSRVTFLLPFSNFFAHQQLTHHSFSFPITHSPPPPKTNSSKITENQITAKLCLERIHSSEVDRTRISQSALNNLTEGDFVFMVVDMMKNSGWYGQADRILELVGVSVGLQNEDDDSSSGHSTTSTKRKREE